MLEERLDEELALLRTCFPAAERNGRWFRIPAYPTADGWSVAATDVTFLANEAHPGAPPYGIYVLTGIRFNDQMPDNYVDQASQQPPFTGSWAMFSWQPEDGEWRATTDIRKGANLLKWVQGFAERFKQGK